MGWLILLVMVLVIVGLLWRFGRLPRSSIELVGAALLLGVSGYVWQGHPDLPGSPVSNVRAPMTGELETTAERKAMMGQFNGAAQWVDTSDALIRNGSTSSAVAILRTATRRYPNNPDLWIGFGNALVEHGGGQINPAAQFAFQHAADLSPEHPGPPFFFGLALARSGQFDKAEAIWRELLARTPATASWRPDLEKRLAQLDAEMRRGGMR